MTQEVEVLDFLEHFGVKGMKWGANKVGNAAAGAARGVVNLERKRLDAARSMNSKIGEKISSNKIPKADLKTARKEIYTDVAKVYTSRRKVGAAVAASLLFKPAIGSAVIGTQMMRGAGYSKGKSLAVGALSGPLGAVVAIEMKARSNARANN